ncbi:MAG: hypothetical protein ACI8SA_000760 [Dokdonia sp.]
MLWNCENQNESIIEATISLEDSNNYPNKISSIPFQELPFNLQETISKSKTLLKSKNETSVIFDSEIILKNVENTYPFWYSLGVTMVCLLTQIHMPLYTQQHQRFICSNTPKAFGFTHKTSQKSIRQYRVL